MREKARIHAKGGRMRRSLWEFLTSAGAPSSAAREALRAATWVVNVTRDNNDPDIYLAISNLQILPRPLHVSLPDAEDGRRRPAWPREACPGQGSGVGVRGGVRGRASAPYSPLTRCSGRRRPPGLAQTQPWAGGEVERG